MVIAGPDRTGEFEGIKVMNSSPNEVGAETNEVNDSLRSMQNHKQT